ncbi:MAG TPA: acetylglutamate kinase [Longimicrobiales bacterium]|nr:acetylglutamate kinase [Longimicrobiales bacterium]
MTERVIKIGGAALADAAWLTSFADAVAAAGSPLVIVHGGGPEITALSDRLAVETRWHEGRRVTPPEAMDVAAMVLNGLVSTRVTAALLAAGVDAVGLSGVDGGLLTADLLEGGLLGRVGVVRGVRTGLLRSLLQEGHTVVVSPVSLCADGNPVNVNADDAASAIAAALGAAELVFLTDVPGVRGTAGLCTRLDAGDALGLVRSGVAFGGMGVKLSASVRALDAGVPSIRIGDARVLYDGAAGTVVRHALEGVA